jgi:GT2 family glycosyltransferase
MIYTSIPYSSDKRLGKAYNTFMNKLPNEDDIGCLLDHDAMFTTTDWHKQISAIAEKNPEAGCFVTMTNRIGCKWQRQPGVDQENHDMKYHREVGQQVQQQSYDTVEDVTNKDRQEVLGGVMILLRKSVWRKIGGFTEDGILGVDNDLHWRIQKYKQKVYLMRGVYLYHWYRADGKGKKHLL